MHYLSIGAIFKNEQMVLKEWIEHHLYHGVEHFYLINDNSNDDFQPILEPYINDGLITLFHNDIPKVKHRQTLAYEKYFRSILNNTKWLAIIDIDEYLYSPNTINVAQELRKYENCGAVEVNWMWFGSSGHISQPKYIVDSFCKRAPKNYETWLTLKSGNVHCGLGAPKNILNTSFKIHKFGIHSHEHDGKLLNASLKKENPDFLLNHYAVMSQEYWVKVKQTRGDADNHHPDDARDLNYFQTLDINIEDDFVLANQNKAILHKL